MLTNVNNYTKTNQFVAFKDISGLWHFQMHFRPVDKFSVVLNTTVVKVYYTVVIETYYYF